MEDNVIKLMLEDRETYSRLLGYHIRKSLIRELTEESGFSFKIMTRGEPEVRVSTKFSSWIIVINRGVPKKLLHHDNAASNDFSQGPIIKEGIRYHEHTGSLKDSDDINLYLEYIRDHELSQFSPLGR